MKKIDKSILFSKKYQTWVSELTIPHPKTSCFYLDVVMDLMRCQNGLCAYTEVLLCHDSGWLVTENWHDGRYITFTRKPCDGDLEHFNSRLKTNENWKWENLFVVKHEINTLKGYQDIDYILKPDAQDYNPFDLLEYNRETHMYVANRVKSHEDQMRIKEMIKILGLNNANIVKQRGEVIERAFEFNTINIENQFPTAFSMIKNEYEIRKLIKI